MPTRNGTSRTLATARGVVQHRERHHGEQPQRDHRQQPAAIQPRPHPGEPRPVLVAGHERAADPPHQPVGGQRGERRAGDRQRQAPRRAEEHARGHGEHRAGQRGDRDQAWSATNRSGAHAPAAATSARTPATPPHRIAQTATTTATSTATSAATSRPHLTSTNGTGPVRVIASSRPSRKPEGDARRWGSRARSARARCDAASFSAADSSADVRVSPPARRSGRSRTRWCRVGPAVRRPATHRDDRLVGRRAPRAPRRTRTPPPPLVGDVADLGQQQVQVGPVVTVAAAQRADSTPGIPFSASTAEPGIVGHAGNPVAAAPSRAFARAFSSNVAPVSGASGNSAHVGEPSTRRRTPARESAAARPASRVSAGDQQPRHAPSAAGARR